MEVSLLQSEAIQPAELQWLDGIIEQAASRSYARSLDVSKVAAILRDGEAHSQSSHMTWIMGSITSLTGLGILVGVWYSYNGKRCHCMWKRPLSLEPSGKDIPLQELNVYGIELQGQTDERVISTTGMYETSVDETAVK
jgi:hypothetical protein